MADPAFDPEQIRADIIADAKDAVVFRERGNVRDYERYHRSINRGLDSLDAAADRI